MKCFLFLISILTVLLSGCSGAERAALNHADALMEERPDSALRILQSIDPSNLGGRDLAYYALLMTQAMVKNDIPVVSDSLIAIAYDKYGDDWRGDRGIRSNFYMGEILFNQEKNRESMRYYLTAYEESKRLGNDYWHAKAAERIADLFFIAYNYPEAARYRKDAILFFNSAGKTRNLRYAISDLASIYLNDGQPSLALQTLDSLLYEVEHEAESDANLIDYIQESRINASMKAQKLEEISNHDLELLKSLKSDREKLETSILLSKINSKKCDLKASDSILRSAKSYLYTLEDTLELLYARYQIADKDHDKEIKLQLADSLLLLQERLSGIVLKESITAAQSDFYESNLRIQRKASRLYLLMILLVILILILTIVFFWKLQAIKSRLHRKEIEAQLDSIKILKTSAERLEMEKGKLNLQMDDTISSITTLTNMIEEKNLLVGQLKNEVEESRLKANMLEEKLNLSYQSNSNSVLLRLFRDQWTTLNMLCDEYFELADTESGRNHILKNIEKELKKISSKGSLAKIEKEVNMYLDNIMIRLRKQCNFLNEKDITFLMLEYAGFSVRAICLFTNIKYGNYYVKRSRLIKKISQSKAVDKEEFIEKTS